MLSYLFISLYCALSEYRNTCTDRCPIYYRVNFRCDPECMNPECNYDFMYDFGDKYSTFEQSPCFYSCECDQEKLTNGKCDSECDNYQCAFDLGDCGYCDSGCFLEDLESDTCKNECSLPGCYYYDLNPCQKFCAPNCSIEVDLFSKNACKDECLAEDCLKYENTACKILKCSPECTYSFLGDSKCQSVCYNSLCDYDRGDCDCSVGCFNTTGDCLTTKNFKDPCDTESCNYKDGKCSFCASGCLNQHLGDGICRPECNNKSCDYDHGDCECAPGCSFIYNNSTSKFSPIGNSLECSQNCLVPGCRFGLDFCTDEALIKKSVLDFLVYKDFEKLYNKYDCRLNSYESCSDQKSRVF